MTDERPASRKAYLVKLGEHYRAELEFLRSKGTSVGVTTTGGGNTALGATIDGRYLIATNTDTCLLDFDNQDDRELIPNWCVGLSDLHDDTGDGYIQVAEGFGPDLATAYAAAMVSLERGDFDIDAPSVPDDGDATVIINAGSGGIAHAGQGWTNTYAEAAANARKWLDAMTRQGFADIEMTDDIIESEGTWKFVFRHTITGVEVVLWMHGIDDLAAYRNQKLYDPRIYWNDSSCATPQIEDFAAEGFSPVMTYRPDDGSARA